MPAALAAARNRLLLMTDRLSAGDWRAPSRCEQWSVHDVLRHVRDGCRRHVDQLGDLERSVLDPGFSARQTPLRWLVESEGETCEATVDDFRALVAEESATLGVHVAAYRDSGVSAVQGPAIMGPFGPVHWTVLTTHVFWDAWLHLRDVTAALGWPDESAPVEEEVLALYALLIASVPAALTGFAFSVTTDLTGRDGRHHLGSVSPGHASVRCAAEPVGDEQLEGELSSVVDSLAGRGPDLPAVLRGDRAALEPLSWLRPVLVPQLNEPGISRP